MGMLILTQGQAFSSIKESYIYFLNVDLLFFKIFPLVRVMMQLRVKEQATTYRYESLTLCGATVLEIRAY
jgi:hypothetical protein